MRWETCVNPAQCVAFSWDSFERTTRRSSPGDDAGEGAQAEVNTMLLGAPRLKNCAKRMPFQVWPCNCFPFSQYFCVSVLESVSLLLPGTVTRTDLHEDPHQFSWSWFFLRAKGCLFHDSRGRRLAFSRLPLCLWRSHVTPPHPLHTLKGSRAMMEWSRVPREMQTGCVCVILRFPPRAFTPSKVNYFINSCHVWQAFL